ncbi:MAG TPA: hypothetical protein VFI72_04420 [Candidatus Angelobacter sp.]|nr:hypothetical protein [Candidatus Angelobacter sp.]
MKSKAAFLFIACIVTTLSWADTLELKNGSVIKGTYVGGSETEVSFRVGSTVQQYSVADVASLKFEARDAAVHDSAARDTSGFASRPAETLAPSAPASTTVARTSTTSTPVAAAGKSLTVPSGTRLMVRTIDAVDSDRNHPGDKFLASLEQPLVVGDVQVAPRGASVYGRLEEVKESGQLSGKAQLRLSLTGIVINGQTVPLTTGDYELSGKSRGASTAKKVGGGAALGAVIGAIAGGGKGAAIGAGVGAGAGTAVQVMTKGDQVHVPSETLLEFTIDQPVTFPLTQAER